MSMSKSVLTAAKHSLSRVHRRYQAPPPPARESPRNKAPNRRQSRVSTSSESQIVVTMCKSTVLGGGAQGALTDARQSLAQSEVGGLDRKILILQPSVVPGTPSHGSAQGQRHQQEEQNANTNANNNNELNDLDVDDNKEEEDDEVPTLKAVHTKEALQKILDQKVQRMNMLRDARQAKIDDAKKLYDRKLFRRFLLKMNGHEEAVAVTNKKMPLYSVSLRRDEIEKQKQIALGKRQCDTLEHRFMTEGDEPIGTTGIFLVPPQIFTHVQQVNEEQVKVLPCFEAPYTANNEQLRKRLDARFISQRTQFETIVHAVSNAKGTQCDRLKARAIKARSEQTPADAPLYIDDDGQSQNQQYYYHYQQHGKIPSKNTSAVIVRAVGPMPVAAREGTPSGTRSANILSRKVTSARVQERDALNQSATTKAAQGQYAVYSSLTRSGVLKRPAHVHSPANTATATTITVSTVTGGAPIGGGGGGNAADARHKSVDGVPESVNESRADAFAAHHARQKYHEQLIKVIAQPQSVKSFAQKKLWDFDDVFTVPTRHDVQATQKELRQIHAKAEVSVKKAVTTAMTAAATAATTAATSPSTRLRVTPEQLKLQMKNYEGRKLKFVGENQHAAQTNVSGSARAWGTFASINSLETQPTNETSRTDDAPTAEAALLAHAQPMVAQGRRAQILISNPMLSRKHTKV